MSVLAINNLSIHASKINPIIVFIAQCEKRGTISVQVSLSKNEMFTRTELFAIIEKLEDYATKSNEELRKSGWAI